MKHFIYFLSLSLIITSVVLMAKFPDSYRAFMYAGGILTLAIPLNIFSYTLGLKKVTK